MSTTLNPYLHFSGVAAEAMAFYREVFGGELKRIRFGEAPMPVPPGTEALVMHAELRADGVLIQASDLMPGMAVPVAGQVTLALGVSSREEQDRLWNALADGGAAIQPLSDQFWGRFGILADRYGVVWMLNLNVVLE